MIEKKKYFYFRQYPIDFASCGKIYAMVRHFNNQERFLGYAFKATFEDLISLYINSFGKIPTIKENDNYVIDKKQLKLFLNVDDVYLDSFLQAIIDFDLIKLSKESYYIKDISQLVGTTKKSSKTKNKKTRTFDDDDDVIDASKYDGDPGNYDII